MTLPDLRLTDRQRAVLRLVALGLTNEEIADRLGYAKQAWHGTGRARSRSVEELLRRVWGRFKARSVEGNRLGRREPSRVTLAALAWCMGIASPEEALLPFLYPHADTEKHGGLWRGVARLPWKQQGALRLKGEGYTEREIARSVGSTADGVSQLLTRARKHLREAT